MTLIVEDGTGLLDSESYASVAQFSKYHADRGNAVTLTDAEIEAALRKATDYLQQVYYGRWAGYRAKETQALDWPRWYVPRDPSVTYPLPQQITAEVEGYFYPFNELPKPLIDAACELALKATTQPLLPDFDRVPKRETVGPITVEYETNKSPVVTYPAIDRLLSRLLASQVSIGGATTVEVMRK